MILFFDTETTGLPNFNERARHPSQPHIVQLAAIAMTNDMATDLDAYNVIIKPDGWTIPKEASDVHGITMEKAACGVSEKEAAMRLLEMIGAASLIVAHNIQFDKFIARIAMRRYDLITDAQDLWWKQLPTFCTMRASTDICKLPGSFAGQYRWPKLQEVYQHAFGETFNGAHDALADVRACVRVYRWLQTRNAEVAA